MSHLDTSNTFLVSTTAALFLMGKGFEPLSVTVDQRPPLFRFAAEALDAHETFHEAKFRLNRFVARATEQIKLRSGDAAS